MTDAPGEMVGVRPERSEYFRRHLDAWFDQHGRHYPWRDTGDPYHILVAERMLHRTRADQVVDTYCRFIDRFPTVHSLAAATPDEVTAILATLGLAWRLATFIPMARRIVESFGGEVPASAEELLRLPGVGPYTADAVLVFAFNFPVAVVDTNTIRVAGRYLAGEEWRGDNRKRNSVRAAVMSLLDAGNPSRSNQTVLDLGALVCQAHTPMCHLCPVSATCVWARNHNDLNVTTGATDAVPFRRRR